MDLSLLFRYRVSIARIGETDLFHWWESSALTDEGRYALSRLFRQTAEWAAIELAIEAARLRHEALVPPGEHLTLFNLGPVVEYTFTAWLQRVRARGGLGSIAAFPKMAGIAHGSVAEAFQDLGLPLNEIKPRLITDRAIQVAHSSSDELQTQPLRVLRSLLAGYGWGSRQQFLAPYVTVS